MSASIIVQMELIILIAKVILEIIKQWQSGQISTGEAVKKVSAIIARKTKVSKAVATQAVEKVLLKREMKARGIMDELGKALNLVRLVEQILKAIQAILQSQTQTDTV